MATNEEGTLQTTDLPEENAAQVTKYHSQRSDEG
jgi:hypothetical protein